LKPSEVELSQFRCSRSAPGIRLLRTLFHDRELERINDLAGSNLVLHIVQKLYRAIGSLILLYCRSQFVQ